MSDMRLPSLRRDWELDGREVEAGLILGLITQCGKNLISRFALSLLFLRIWLQLHNVLRE